MKKMNKLIAALTVTTMLTSTSFDLESREYCVDCGGCGYEDAYQSCCLAPAVGFAIAAIAAIIAVGVHNRSGSTHGHNE